MPLHFSRRQALAAAGAFLILSNSRSARTYAANEKVNVALVGVSGRGEWFVGAMPKLCNIVALCDVNEHRAKPAFEKFPNVPKHADFRKMLDVEKSIEAVVVATPDNTHAVISMTAIKQGKHVFCEKPLTHDVRESRLLREAANKHKVATQMGNQGTASPEFRKALALIRAGVMGQIKVVHAWNESGGGGPRPVPPETPPTPATLNWDLWLGPAAERPYNPRWMQWHQWRDFATGNLGNWASHSANLAFMAMKIDSLWSKEFWGDKPPRLKLEAKASAMHGVSFPKWEMIRWDIPARGEMPPVEFNWYNGRNAPEARKIIEDLIQDKLDWGDAGEKRYADHAGCVIVGQKGVVRLTGHNATFKLVPAKDFEKVPEVPQVLPRSRGHENEWLSACKGGEPAASNFNYSSLLNEFLQLGNIATQFEGPIEYDPLACKVVNNEKADGLLMREYRKGWEIL